uniref:Apoptotic chromatin condensation inducer 1b n=1 Tax=Tetraodon nigroviridis TaxID=99883 RepID=H3D8K4_TETNG
VGVWTSGGSKMADEDITLDGKPLQSLRVADLKAALEQRNLSKSGQKNTLIKRLKGALMLENLQKSSTSHCGLQPNSQIGQEMSQNSFIQQYLAKQQELLRQRLEREAQQNEEANDSPAVAEDDEDQSEDNDSSIHLSKKVSTRGPFVDGISLSRRAGHPRLPVVQLCVGKRLLSFAPVLIQALQQHSQPSATRSDPDAGSWDSSSLRGGSRSQDATVCLSPQDTRSPPLPSPPRAIASLSVRVLAQPPAVPRTNEEGAAPTEPGSAHPVLHLSRSAGGRAGPGPGGARRGSRAPPQPQQMPPSMPATFARSKRKLQPPQHIPPPQPAPAHHAPMQLRHPTPPPSPPPNLFPLPDTPKQSPPDTGEQEGEAARGPRGASFAPSSMQNKDSDSSSCSSSPEPSGKRKPGPLSLLVQKMESEGGKESADGPASSSKSPPHTAERKALQESKGGEEVRHFSTEERQPEGMEEQEEGKKSLQEDPKQEGERSQDEQKRDENSDSSSDSDSTSGSSSSSSSSEDKSNHAKPSSGLPVESKPSSSRRPAGRERVTCWPMPPELVSVHRRFKLTPFSSRVTQSHAQKSLDNFKTLYLKSDKPAEMTPLHQANDLNNSTPCQMWKSGPSGPDHTTSMPHQHLRLQHQLLFCLQVVSHSLSLTHTHLVALQGLLHLCVAEGGKVLHSSTSASSWSLEESERSPREVSPSAPAVTEMEAESESSVVPQPPPGTEPESREGSTDEVRSPKGWGEERDKIADPAPKTFAARKISLASNKTPPANADGGMSDADAASAAGRKRRWGSSTAVIAKKPSISITTDSLKSLIPDIKVNQEAVVELHPEELQLSGDEESPEAGADDQDKGLKIRRTVTQVVPSESHENGQEGEAERGEEPGRDAPSLPTHAPDTHPPSDPPAAATVAPSDSAVRRSISQQKSGVCITIDDPIRTTRQPSPSRGKLSNIVHVTNLVRPFTLGQLKELLNRTGTVVEEGFWIDKIKSHCFVTYATTEEAAATREALHRVKWPQSNPKVLHVDFCQQDELDFHKGILKPEEKEDHVVQPSAPPNRLPPLMRPAGVRDLWAEREKEMQRRERARGEREWDRDKVREFARPGEEERRSRSRSRDRFCPPAAEKADEPPAKLLDDLFLKTKAAPCIYWLPLTEEQVLQKVLDRTERQKERERRHRLKVREKDGSVPAVAGGDGERERGRDREGDKKREGGHRPRRPSEGPAGLRRSRSRSNPRDRRRGRHRSQHQEYSRRSESRS